MRVAAEDKRCVEVDGVSGRRYRAKDGFFEVSERDGKAIVKSGGFVPGMTGAYDAKRGFDCAKCGFGSWFRTCSRCGTQN